MTQGLVPAATVVDALAATEEELAKIYGRAAKSARTRIEYARDWAHFAAWCAERGLASLPASAPVVARYLGTLGASLKIASIRPRTSRSVAAARTAARARSLRGRPRP